MRWRLGIWLVSLVSAGIVFLIPAAVSADTGGYPYHAKPCVHAPYAVHGAKVNWCRNYDWGDKRNDTSRANVISPYGYYYRNCTDYAAWKVAALGVAPGQYQGLGDAKRWATPPAKNGLRVDGVPAVGSVAVRTTGIYGHVAFVEAVSPTGSITVSEYNKRADGAFGRRSGTPASLGFTHFVHFEAHMSPPPMVAPSTPPPPAPAPVPPTIPPEVTAPTPSLTAPGTSAPHEIPAQTTNGQPASAGHHLPSATTDTQQANASAKPEAARRIMEPGPTTAAQKVVLPDAALPADMSDQLAESVTSTERATPLARAHNPVVRQEDESHAAGSANNVSGTGIPPIMASTLPVPHQWWREATTSPPSTSAEGAKRATAFAQQFVSPLGYWALGCLVIVVVLREWYPLATSMPTWRRMLRL